MRSTPTIIRSRPTTPLGIHVGLECLLFLRARVYDHPTSPYGPGRVMYMLWCVTELLQVSSSVPQRLGGSCRLLTLTLIIVSTTTTGIDARWAMIQVPGLVAERHTPNQFSSKTNKKALGLSHGCASGPSSVTTRHHHHPDTHAYPNRAHTSNSDRGFHRPGPRKEEPAVHVFSENTRTSIPFRYGQNRRDRHPFSNPGGRGRGPAEESVRRV